MASNTPQTTFPLVLGMGLDADPRIVAQSLSIPVTGQNANLVAQAGTADIGTSFPLALGIQLATGGVSNYQITAQSLSIPVTSRDATLMLSAEGADVGVTFPLALGISLGVASYTLTCESLAIYVSFAPGEAYEEDAAPIAETRASRNAAFKGKRRAYSVTIDGEEFIVWSIAEAEELLKAAVEAAKDKAQAVVKRIEPLRGKAQRKALKAARQELAAPTISASDELLAAVLNAKSQIENEYEAALMVAVAIEKARRQEEEIEELLLLL